MDSAPLHGYRSAAMASTRRQLDAQALPCVLVVDDEPGMLETLNDVLQAQGYEVYTANSGAAAILVIAAATCLSVVLMDIKMPGVNGVEAMQRMRALAPDVPVVLMTANMSDALAVTAKRNATAVVQKPLDLDRVLPMLRAIVRTHAREISSRPQSATLPSTRERRCPLCDSPVARATGALVVRAGSIRQTLQRCSQCQQRFWLDRVPQG